MRVPRSRGAIALTALLATLVLMLATRTASASKLSITDKTFRMTWSNLTFDGIEEMEDAVIMSTRCPVTMEGSFHSATIRKVEEALIGYITRVRTKEESCTLSAGFLTEGLPWRMRYEGFGGTLPNISSIIARMNGIRFIVRGPLMNCLYAEAEGEGIDTLFGISSGSFVNFAFDEAFRLPLMMGMSPICPREGVPAGLAAVRVLGSATTRISIRLI